MIAAPAAHGWRRRAQPLLGTLVEIGIVDGRADKHASDAGFAVIAAVQACLSRYERASDIARFNGLRRGESLAMRPLTAEVLKAASQLERLTDGLFDISLGSAPGGWRIEGNRLVKLAGCTRLDLGGIGKGFAIDHAVQALVAAGVGSGWVNAGGDLRAFGDAELPIGLRDERRGGVRHFATLRDGAFATSHFGRETRSSLAHRGVRSVQAHVSVAAPCCLWADALTKVVAASGDTAHPVLAHFGASAWQH
ncbi:MAG TPA: FAD:protein FMN transferase [Burkholderiaceae bacterium]|nr:FAD:protein FMN transferase [Burkholderiaceae bacterium]